MNERDGEGHQSTEGRLTALEKAVRRHEDAIDDLESHAAMFNGWKQHTVQPGSAFEVPLESDSAKATMKLASGAELFAWRVARRPSSGRIPLPGPNPER